MTAVRAVSTALALVWVTMWMASPAISGPGSEYLALLDAAKAEGKVAIGGFGFDPEEVTTLEKGFQKRFGFPVKIAHDPTHIRDIPPKVIAGGFDVVEVNVAGGYQILESERRLVTVDWSMFYPEFPKLEEVHHRRPAEDIPCLLYVNGIFGIVYNTKLVKEADLPETLEDFAEPKWKGRFVLWDNGNPFDFIAVKYGKERALELARKEARQNNLAISPINVVCLALCRTRSHRLSQRSLPSSGHSWMNAHAASGLRWKPAPLAEGGSARLPRRQGCPGPPSEPACRNWPTRSLPLAHRLPWSGYAVRAGDVSPWVCVICTSSVRWKPWSIR